MDGVIESICESIDEHPGVHVVERHNSLIVVHVDSNAGRLRGDCEAGGGLRPEGVVGPIPQAQEPVAVGRAHSDFAFTVDRTARYPQVPVGFSSHLHLEEKHRGRLLVQTSNLWLVSFNSSICQ